MLFHYFLTFGSSKNSYFVFISIFCIHFLNLRTKKTVYPIWHLILTYEKKKKKKKTTIFTNILTIIFHNLQYFYKNIYCWTHFAENKNATKLFSYSIFIHTFFWVLKAKTKTKNKPKQSFSCVNPKKIENKNRIRTVFQVTKNGHPTF